MDFMDKMKGYVDKGFSASKEALGKAGGAVQDFSDKSVIRLEIRQLESKKKVQLEALAEKTYRILGKNKQAVVSAEIPEIATLVTDLKKIDRDIAKRKKLLTEEKNDTETKEKQ